MSTLSLSVRQRDLSELQRGGIDLVKDDLRRACETLELTAGPVRILDIGCGTMPYADSLFTLGNRLSVSSITLWDKDKGIKTAGTASLPLSLDDHIDFYDAVKEPIEKRFDLIILSGVIHELFIQHTFRRREFDAPFLPWLFSVLKELLAPTGVVLMADVERHRNLTIPELVSMQAVQLELAGHADPPNAFLVGDEIVEVARAEGFDVVRENCSLACPNPESSEFRTLASYFDHHATRAVPSTRLRSIFLNRRWYSLTFSRPRCAPPTLDRGYAKSGIDEVLREATNLSEATREVLSAFRKRLEAIEQNVPSGFRESFARSEIEQAYSDSFGSQTGPGLSSALGESALSTANRWLVANQDPQLHYMSSWFGVNSVLLGGARSRAGRSYTTRFSPKTPDGWYASYSNIGPVDDDPAFHDWTSIAYNVLLNPDVPIFVGRHGREDHRLRPPSVYSWFNKVLKSGKWKRSLTIWCTGDERFQGPGNDQPSNLAFESARFAAAFYDAPRGDHLILALSDGEMGPNSWGNKLDTFCADVTGIAFCSKPTDSTENVGLELWIALQRGIASVYLDFLFLSRAGRHGENNPKIWLEEFRRRWLENPQVRLLEVEDLPSPESAEIYLPATFKHRILEACSLANSMKQPCRYPSSWTTLSIAQPTDPGDPPGTFMFLTDKPLPPPVLEILALQMERPFAVLRNCEIEVLNQRRVKAQEGSNRARAVKGFMHQSRHVFLDKSPLDLARFVDQSDANVTTLASLWPAGKAQEELRARLAQIRYATLVPNIISRLLTPNDQLPRGEATIFYSTTSVAAIEEWMQVAVLPLAQFAASSPKSAWTAQGKSLSIRVLAEPTIRHFTVPWDQLIQTVLFELLLNAFRHGFFSDYVATVLVKISQVRGLTAPPTVLVEVENPCVDGASARCLKSDRGMSYVREFVSRMQSLDDGGLVRLELFESQACLRAVLTLPFKGS